MLLTALGTLLAKGEQQCAAAPHLLVSCYVDQYRAAMASVILFVCIFCCVAPVKLISYFTAARTCAHRRCCVGLTAGDVLWRADGAARSALAAQPEAHGWRQCVQPAKELNTVGYWQAVARGPGGPALPRRVHSNAWPAPAAPPVRVSLRPGAPGGAQPGRPDARSGCR